MTATDIDRLFAKIRYAEWGIGMAEFCLILGLNPGEKSTFEVFTRWILLSQSTNGVTGEMLLKLLGAMPGPGETVRNGFQGEPLVIDTDHYPSVPAALDPDVRETCNSDAAPVA